MLHWGSILYCDTLGDIEKGTEFAFDKSRQVILDPLSRYGMYLKSYYGINSSFEDDKLSIAPCKQFINLSLVSNEVGPQADSAKKTPLEIENVVSPDFPLVLVEGTAGIGKSTLCWELCRLWDTLTSLQHYKIVLHLKLRERCVQNATHLSDIFFHRDKELRRSVAMEVSRCDGEGVLLILDGFDEMPESVVTNKDALIMQLISGVYLPRSTRLLTSRPSVLQHKDYCLPHRYQHVQILGFSAQSRTQYISLALESDPDMLKTSLENFISSPIVSSLMYIPVICAIVVQVCKDIGKFRKVPKTMTELYSTLVLVLIRRHMIETGKWKRQSKVPTDLSSLSPEILKSYVSWLTRVCFKKQRMYN